MEKKDKIIRGHDHGGDFFAIVDNLDLKQNISFAVLNQDDFQAHIESNKVCTADLKPSHFQHAHFDGIGAFSKFLEEKNLTKPELPLNRDKFQPNKLIRLYLFAKAMILGKKIDEKDSSGWKNYNMDKQFNHDDESVEKIDYWFALSLDQTNYLKNQAANAGVSLNSLLLNTLHKTVYANLTENKPYSRWMIPVNMRGPVQLDNPYGNHSVSVEIYQGAKDTPFTTHTKIKKSLSRKQHWKSWIFFTIIGKIGKDKLKEIMSNSQKPLKRTYIGCFSNLGSWIIDNFDQGAILFVPPTGRTSPFTCGAIEINGKLSFAWRKHPTIDISDEDFKRMLVVYRTMLLRELNA